MSPAASKIAAEKNLNLGTLQGTGKDGRITKEDVIKTSPWPQALLNNQEERVRMTRLRQRIAERLKHSQDTAALLTTFNEVDMTNTMTMRSKHKDRFFETHGVKLGFMSFFVSAAVKRYKKFQKLMLKLTVKTLSIKIITISA